MTSHETSGVGVQRWGPVWRFFIVDDEAVRAFAGPGHVIPGSRGQAAAAVGALFRGHHVELVRLALVMTGDLATAEDVVQDAFEELHRRWHGLRDEGGGLLGYARSAVLNRCRSVHRRAAVARKHAPELAGPPAASYPDAAAQAADRAGLLAALRALPRRQREVLVLRYYCDLDVSEVAATLRIAPSTVRSNATRGLARLARTIGED